jgi:hemolysin activation/secretion protein
MAFGLAKAADYEQPRTAGDQPRLLVSRFVVRYEHPNANLPSIDDVATEATARLHNVAGGLTAAEPDGSGLDYGINDRELRDKRFSINGIKAMQDGIRKYLNDQGLVAVFVYAANPGTLKVASPAPLDFAAVADNRRGVEIPLIVVVGIVHDVKTIQPNGGQGLLAIGSTTNPAAKTIAANSPATPGHPINKEQLQDYLYRINRQAGRHVETAISAATTTSDDEVELQYLIKDQKPWTVYFQASNTGTKDTSTWEERFGAIDTNLLGFNDTFTIDYTTASFTNTDTLTGSYDFPIFDMTRAHLKVYGSTDRFTASDVGQSGNNLNGSGWEAGGEGVFNVYQYHQFFVDAVAGARVDYYSVDDFPPGPVIQGDGAFLLPYAGLRLSQQDANSSTHVDVTYTFNQNNPSSPSDTDRGALGRLGTNKYFQLIQGDATESFYIEPLLTDWDDRDTTGRPVAANEVAISARGQYVPNNAVLIPELEQVAGGLYTVRGYAESVTAGDSVIIGSVEYRLHIPRLLGIASANSLFGQDVPAPPFVGGQFHYQPSAAETPGDWDLIFKLFADGAYVHTNGSTSIGDRTISHVNGETDNTLLGVGPGLELQILDNINIQADYGLALDPVRGTLNDEHDQLIVSRYSSRFNFVFTLIY